MVVRRKGGRGGQRGDAGVIYSFDKRSIGKRTGEWLEEAEEAAQSGRALRPANPVRKDASRSYDFQLEVS